MQTFSDLQTELTSALDGDVTNSKDLLAKYSKDTSMFEIEPQLVVFPKHARDVAQAIRLVQEAKRAGVDASLTARAGGSDMTGGPLTNSIVLVFTKYMNHLLDVTPTSANTEMGVFYRNFEKATLKHNALMPSYPASRNLCALGGMVANDAGGELTLKYGKTHRYVEELEVILDDGSTIITRALSESELAQKKELETREGEIYRTIDTMITENEEEILSAEPPVSKNSAGYALWRVKDKKKGTFDLSQLFVGSQGTLGIITRAKMKLVPQQTHKSLLVILVRDFKQLPELVERVLKHNPQSFESYDDKTFILATKFFFEFVRSVGFRNLIKLGFAFIPEVWMTLTGGVPKLVLMAEFAEDSYEAADKRARDAYESLSDLSVSARVTPRGMQSEKYWIIRRESFALLRKNTKGLQAAPFIDDIVVPPESYSEFFPRLLKMLDESKILYTIAGHIGDGNLHIIPLVDMSDLETRKTVFELMPRVYRLVATHDGSTTGEHNDGIVRTPYLPLMYSPAMISLFKEVKDAFDPNRILNPGKKVGGTEDDIRKNLIR